MKPHQGGDRAERTIELWAKSIGYKRVHRSRRARVRHDDGKVMTLSNDLFGCIDICALGSLELPTLWIQSTTPYGVSERKRKIEAIEWPPHDKAMIACVLHPVKGRWSIRTYTYRPGSIEQPWFMADHDFDPRDLAATAKVERIKKHARRKPRGALLEAMSEAKRRQQAEKESQ